MGFIPVQYILIYQKHLIQLTMNFYFKNYILLCNKQGPFAAVFRFSSELKAVCY